MDGYFMIFMENPIQKWNEMDENWGSPMTQETSIFWDPHGPGTPTEKPQFSAWLRGPVVGRNKGYEVEVWFTSGADATVRWFLWVAAYVGQSRGLVHGLYIYINYIIV